VYVACGKYFVAVYKESFISRYGDKTSIPSLPLRIINFSMHLISVIIVFIDFKDFLLKNFLAGTLFLIF
jgi:hypothetical protein